VGQTDLKITVLICTYNRADLLAEVLATLELQTLPQSLFEIVLINDGSADQTGDVVKAYEQRLPIRYFYQENAGLAAAKNYGITQTRAPIVLFMDDDDTASPRLLEEHIEAHQRYPGENFAILGHTELEASVAQQPLMHFVTEVGCYLFSYRSLIDGAILDYTYFWGGRSSCKTGFLRNHGIFNPVFRFGCEDIELGYRLTAQGLKVVYHKPATSTMIRALSLDDFFNRLIRQGESQYTFSQLHKAEEIQRWTEVQNADQEWADIGPAFEAITRSARNLDNIVNQRQAAGLESDEYTLSLLHRSYWNAFRACKLKGIDVRKHGDTTV
jgi:glycosyltransferase involved in cell wall biosynthesis